MYRSTLRLGRTYMHKLFGPVTLAGKCTNDSHYTGPCGRVVILLKPQPKGAKQHHRLWRWMSVGNNYNSGTSVLRLPNGTSFLLDRRFDPNKTSLRKRYACIVTEQDLKEVKK